MHKYLILFISTFIFSIATYAQEKVEPTFPDNSFYNAQMGQERVKNAVNKHKSTWETLFKEKGLNFPVTNIYFRAFKQDKKFEVWARNTVADSFILIKTFDVCANSGKLGPKRKENDKQVPEGFYFLDEYNYKSNYWLSLLVSYPNYADLIKGDKEAPGYDIYVHGNCVTVGCLPMTDDYIEQIYALAVLARTNGQYNIPIHIFPTHYNRRGLEILSKFYNENDNRKFWINLKKGYDYFETSRKLLPIMYDAQGNYVF
jgi:murein L,D-transpeptidase YafK